ncbi:MAG: FlgD immunoglobulin-like domain containing protein, partial [Candidatus Poribacteria bacterium]
ATVVFRAKNVSMSDSMRLSLTNFALADVDARIIRAVVKKTSLRWENLIVPSKSILLPNYPNPFNPETWIPYRLAADSTVVIHIYNDKGQRIHTIPLGLQKAGIYMAKDKAARWDGRDSFGEKVASGVYFYTLQARPISIGINHAIPKIGAGDFSATRKMVIVK